jgi:2'-5' RNA ligase
VTTPAPDERLTDEEIEALLVELEEDLREDIQSALTLTARDFAHSVEAATELTAAAYSVSSIRNLWRRRVTGIMTSLRRILNRGVRTAAGELEEPVPRPVDMDPYFTNYLDATRDLLNEVGDRLAEQATTSLAEGVAAGESVDQLKRRMTTLFDTDGSQLGPTRAARIAATEATRAFNAGQFAAAQAIEGDDRPLVKQWITRQDERVRVTHREANGQLRMLDEPFEVGTAEMMYPGDPSAPADETINCRCILRTASAPERRTASMGDGEFQSNMPEQLKRYWLDGEGAGRIRWGTPGSFDRCVRELRDDFPENTQGLCANLYHEATGRWPGEQRGTAHTGAMVALLPHPEDAARLALDGGESAEELHVTFAFLGEAADWDEESRGSVKAAVEAAASWLSPVRARAFGVAHWNPQSDNPVWVYNIGNGDEGDLEEARREVMWALDDVAERMPRQHSPWAPHVTGVYGEDRTAEMIERLGDVRFDRILVAFGGEYTEFPLTTAEEDAARYAEAELSPGALATTLGWATPEPTALAFENQQTGDGRIFAPGALYWEGESWPLQYADRMLGGHDGAALAGSIDGMGRLGDRVSGYGKLFLTQPAGIEAASLLAQGAPLGVSVDLDDVDLEMVSTDPDEVAEYKAQLLTASLLPTEDGGYVLVGETAPEMAASATGTVIESQKVRFVVSPGGTVPGDLFELRAAAGEADVEGPVVEQQRSGEYLLRITRGRVRGATLVSIPAFAGARIVLDKNIMFPAEPMAASAGKQVGDYDRVLRHVRYSAAPVGAAAVAAALRIPAVSVLRHLVRAATRGEVVKITSGVYAAKKPVLTDAETTASAVPEELVASVTGAVDLPVADRDEDWDGDGARDRVFQWADGDPDKIGRAFAYRDDDADPTTKAAYKLGYADVDDGELVIIPRGVFAAQAATEGARGGVDIPADELAAVRERLAAVRAHVDEVTGEEDMDDMQASAWAALKDAPKFPAEWFREPTAAELPPGGPGVNYANGRIFGWVAQAGEPHAGFAKKITIDTLGRIDTSHFLRQRFTLDDGSIVKAGAYTMNAGHHRDGAECETSACQFDDTRTVAGIVTVGMNERGMWFSGAAAPWLSEWDRSVFMATQPSYHMRKAPGGGWQLRAVLGVPVPGHSSPLLASAVVDRSNLALTAAATMAEVEAAVETEAARQGEEATASIDVQIGGIDYDRLADAIVAAGIRAEQRKAAEAAELEALLAEARNLEETTTGIEGD